MAEASLEHANITVSNPKATAKLLSELFGWHIRWQGDAINGGYSIHVGGKDSYIALYAPGDTVEEGASSYSIKGGLNHLGVVVDDLDAAEAKIKAAGYETYSHADYEPGRRFYFDEDNGVEIEVVSYN